MKLFLFVFFFCLMVSTISQNALIGTWNFIYPLPNPNKDISLSFTDTSFSFHDCNVVDCTYTINNNNGKVYEYAFNDTGHCIQDYIACIGNTQSQEQAILNALINSKTVIATLETA